MNKFIKKGNKTIFLLLLNLLLLPLYLALVYRLITYVLIGLSPNLVIGTDFISYLTGGLMVRKGFGEEIYNLNQQFSFQLAAIKPQVRESILPFKSPPVVALFFIPFTFFPVVVSYRLFIVLNLFFLVIIIRYLSKIFPKIKNLPFWYLMPFLYLGSVATVIVGQISFLLVFIFSYAYKALKAKKDFYLGFILGFILIKPQYIISIPYLYLLTKNRKLFLKGLFLSTIIFIFINILISGIQPLVEYSKFILVTETPLYGSKIDQMITINSFLLPLFKYLEFNPIYSVIINFFLYFVSLFLFAKKHGQIKTNYLYMAVLIFTLLFAVHVNVHDLSILIIAIFILINLAGSEKGIKKYFLFMSASSLFFLPLIVFIFNPFMGTIVLILLIFYLFFERKIILMFKTKCK